MHLTGSEYSMIAAALRVAAEQYGKDSRTATDAGQARLATQFIKQRDEAYALADRIEEVAL